MTCISASGSDTHRFDQAQEFCHIAGFRLFLCTYRYWILAKKITPPHRAKDASFHIISHESLHNIVDKNVTIKTSTKGSIK